MFFKAVAADQLDPRWANILFKDVMSYETSNPDFDAAAMKNKLYRLKLIYASKAHQDTSDQKFLAWFSWSHPRQYQSFRGYDQTIINKRSSPPGEKS